MNLVQNAGRRVSIAYNPYTLLLPGNAKSDCFYSVPCGEKVITLKIVPVIRTRFFIRPLEVRSFGYFGMIYSL